MLYRYLRYLQFLHILRRFFLQFLSPGSGYRRGSENAEAGPLVRRYTERKPSQNIKMARIENGNELTILQKMLKDHCFRNGKETACLCKTEINGRLGPKNWYHAISGPTKKLASGFFCQKNESYL